VTLPPVNRSKVELIARLFLNPMSRMYRTSVLGIHS